MIQFLFLMTAAPFIGSFLGVLIDRLQRGHSIVLSRSQCTECHHTLRPADLVPILSWAFLRGKCRYCSKRISAFYPGIEFAALAIAFWAATVTQDLVLIASCVLGWTLLPLAVIDWRTLTLPDKLTYPLCAAGLVAAYVLDSPNFADHVIGMTVGFLCLFGIGWIYHRIRQRDGLGLGDAKLFGALGAWLGWQGLPSVILFAALAALICVLIRPRLDKSFTSEERLPFGPFLATAGWIVWLYGPLTSFQ